MTGQEKSDLLIEVTAWEGLTVNKFKKKIKTIKISGEQNVNIYGTWDFDS